MAPIEALPTEIVLHIAELTTWLDSGSRLGARDPRRGSLRSYSRLTRSSRHFHNVLNAGLYHHNLKKDAPLDSCVLWAAQFGRLATLKRAHSYGADLSANGARNEEDLTLGFADIPGRLRFLASPLHFAIQNGDREMFDYLMQHNVDLDVPSRSFCRCDAHYDGPRMYPLHTALDHSSIGDAASILAKRGAHLLSKGSPAICRAASVGNIDVVETLLQRPEPLAIGGALHYAIEKRDLDLVRELLARPGADATIKNQDLRSPLHLALVYMPQTGDGVLKLLLERPEIDISAADGEGDTPLHFCARLPDLLEVAKLLLARSDANASATNEKGFTPLLGAARAGNIPMFNLLLDQPGVDLHVADQDDRTVLHMVCSAPETEETVAFVASLIDRGVPLNRESESGTALYCAFAQHNLETAQLLLARGADAETGGDADRPKSVLHHCLERPHPLQLELTRELLARGVEFDRETNEDEARDLGEETAFSSAGTPLFFAAAGAKNVGCMRLLLEAGADVEARVVSKSCFDYEGLEMMEDQGFIAALFRHTWVDDRDAEMSDESVDELKDRLEILLEHGATIGNDGCGISALAFAMTHASAGKPALLNFLVEEATSFNIHPEDVQQEIDEEDREYNEEVLQVVRLFKQRLMGEGNDADEEGMEDEEEGEEVEEWEEESEEFEEWEEEDQEEEEDEDSNDENDPLGSNEDRDGDTNMM